MRFVVTQADQGRWTWHLFWGDGEVARADHDYGSEALARDAANEFARDVSSAERSLLRR